MPRPSQSPSRVGRDPGARRRSASATALVLVGGLAAACHGYRVEVTEIPEVSPFDGPAELGTVCVLRPQVFAAAAQAVHRDNGRVVGVTQGGRVFFCYRVEPGAHRLSAFTDNEPVLDLVVRSGETVFVRLRLNLGPDELVPASAAEARALLPELDAVVAHPAAPGARPIFSGPVPAAGQ